ncbi:MAG: hypothetical protein ACE5OZ_25375 [Candidatus Heimdallarchaeota archaeon]
MDYNVNQGKSGLVDLLRERQGWHVHYIGDIDEYGGISDREGLFLGDCSLLIHTDTPNVQIGCASHIYFPSDVPAHFSDQEILADPRGIKIRSIEIKIKGLAGTEHKRKVLITLKPLIVFDRSEELLSFTISKDRLEENGQLTIEYAKEFESQFGSEFIKEFGEPTENLEFDKHNELCLVVDFSPEVAADFVETLFAVLSKLESLLK